MRCNNCGWTNNPSGSQKCEKCNAPLMGSMVADNHQHHNINEPQAPLKSTIPSGSSGLPYVDSPYEAGETPKQPKPGSNCECGYPLTAESKFCPNCKKAVNGSDSRSDKPNPNPRKGTIDPFANNSFSYSGSCQLKPIESQTDSSRFITFSESTILNRGNVDPNNNAITSREQANLEYRDGDWYITDLSDQQTTFVRKAGAVKLEDGDVVLMGNRRFVFSK